MRVTDLFLPVSLLLFIIFSILYPQEMIEYSSLITLILVVVILLQFFFMYERRIGGPKEVAITSILGAFSAAARIPFAGIPSVQPCTFIVLVSGYAFGPTAGFMIGAETALLSNFFLGQGPWTPWQMLAWGIMGPIGYLFRIFFEGKKHELLAFMVTGAMAGYAFGVIMNIWHWLTFVYPHTWESFLLVELSSIWFDTLHAAGNVIFIDLFAIRFISILERYQKRFALFINHLPSK